MHGVTRSLVTGIKYDTDTRQLISGQAAYRDGDKCPCTVVSSLTKEQNTVHCKKNDMFRNDSSVVSVGRMGGFDLKVFRPRVP